MMSRMLVVLVAGFGVLLGFVVLQSWLISRHVAEIEISTSQIQHSFQESERALSELQTKVLLIGLLSRDFLLDPDPLAADSYRAQLNLIKTEVEDLLPALEATLSKRDSYNLPKLKSELVAYLNAREPFFNWTPAERSWFGPEYLRSKTIPRRKSILALVDQMRRAEQDEINEGNARIAKSWIALRARSANLTTTILVLCLLVAAVSVFQISRLEKAAVAFQRETEKAEHRMRVLSRELMHSGERERKSISRELHDDVGQMLTSMRMEITNLENLRGSPEAFQSKLSEIRRLVEDTMRTVRGLAMGLRPSMLDDLGLEPALQWQAREFSRRSNVPVTIDVDGSVDNLPDPYRTCIYKVVQEALTNVARHASPASVRIAVHRSEHGISGVVQDDGKGFDPAHATAGIGLIGIYERVRELGGSAEIHSSPGRGTAIQIQLPI